MCKRLVIVVAWLVIGWPYLPAQPQNPEQVKSILQRMKELEATTTKLQAVTHHLQAKLAQSRQQIDQLQTELRRSKIRITYLSGQQPEGIANGTVSFYIGPHRTK